jgi:hypothetical protein
MYRDLGSKYNTLYKDNELCNDIRNVAVHVEAQCAVRVLFQVFVDQKQVFLYAL